MGYSANPDRTRVPHCLLRHNCPNIWNIYGAYTWPLFPTVRHDNFVTAFNLIYHMHMLDMRRLYLSFVSHRKADIHVTFAASRKHAYIIFTYPIEPYFYIVKLGFTGYTLSFLFLIENIDCGYSLGSNEYPQSIFWAKIWKISVFLSENFQFWTWNFLYIWIGVYIIFLIFNRKHRMWVLIRTASPGGSNEYPQSMFWAKIWKISVFFSENFQFLEVKFSLYLNRRIFVMV